MTAIFLALMTTLDLRLLVCEVTVQPEDVRRAKLAESQVGRDVC